MTSFPEGENEPNHVRITNNHNVNEDNTTYESDETPGEEKNDAEIENIDPELVQFLKKHDLIDMKQQILSSKLKVSHFQGVEKSDLEDLCSDLQLSSSQKIRLKHAINALQKRIIRTSIRNKMKLKASQSRSRNRRKQFRRKQPMQNNVNTANNSEQPDGFKNTHNQHNIHRLKSKIVIVGQAAVGKTTLQKAMMGYPFESGSKATFAVSSTHRKSQYKYKDVHMMVDYEIFDTPGLDRFCDMITLYLRGALAVIVVYDVCDHTSFEKAKWWINYLDNNASGYDKIILIANKIDIKDEIVESDDDDDMMDETDDDHDIITEGRLHATERGIAFLEVSAKNRENVNVLLSWIDKQSKTNVAKNPHILQRKAASIKLHDPLLHGNMKNNGKFLDKLDKFEFNFAKCCAL